jgi:hypothetical protein
MRGSMPKKTGEFDVVIRLWISQEDKERFEAEAKRLRVSMSAWLRMAGLEKLEHDREKKGGK